VRKGRKGSKFHVSKFQHEYYELLKFWDPETLDLETLKPMKPGAPSLARSLRERWGIKNGDPLHALSSKMKPWTNKKRRGLLRAFFFATLKL
jgi:hypothetical protein